MGRSAVKKARIVTQLTLILACALLLTMALTLAMLVRTRNRQRQADHDFFQIKIEEKTSHVSGQLKTLNVVSAQLCQNKLIQAFLTETDTLERWRYKQYVEYLLNILRSSNSDDHQHRAVRSARRGLLRGGNVAGIQSGASGLLRSENPREPGNGFRPALPGQSKELGANTPIFTPV